MNIQDPMISEQQLQNMMMNEAESFSYIRHEITQEMNHWKREALISQQLQRENLAKSQSFEKSSKQQRTQRVSVQQVVTPCYKNMSEIKK